MTGPLTAFDFHSRCLWVSHRFKGPLISDVSEAWLVGKSALPYRNSGIVVQFEFVLHVVVRFKIESNRIACAKVSLRTMHSRRKLDLIHALSWGDEFRLSVVFVAQTHVRSEKTWKMVSLQRTFQTLHCKVAWKVCYFWLAGGRPTWTWKYETEHFSYCTRVYQLICLQYLHRINSSFHFHLLSKRMPWNRFIQHTYTFAAVTHHLAIHIKFRCSALQICEVMAICKADHNSNELFPVFAKQNKKVSLLSAVKTEIFIAGMIK